MIVSVKTSLYEFFCWILTHEFPAANQQVQHIFSWFCYCHAPAPIVISSENFASLFGFNILTPWVTIFPLNINNQFLIHPNLLFNMGLKNFQSDLIYHHLTDLKATESKDMNCWKEVKTILLGDMTWYISQQFTKSNWFRNCHCKKSQESVFIIWLFLNHAQNAT